MPANNWKGPLFGDQLWDVAGNWSLGVVPDSDSDVTIGKAGSYTVVIAATDPPFTVSGLTLKGAGNHTLTDHGVLSVDARTTVLGNTLHVAADGTANLTNVRLDSTATVIDQGLVNIFGTFAGSGLTTPLIYQIGPKTSAKSGWSCSICEKRCISGRSLVSGMVGIRS